MTTTIRMTSETALFEQFGVKDVQNNTVLVVRSTVEGNEITSNELVGHFVNKRVTRQGRRVREMQATRATGETRTWEATTPMTAVAWIKGE